MLLASLIFFSFFFKERKKDATNSFVRAQRRKKEDVALIRGILNTLLTPQEKEKLEGCSLSSSGHRMRSQAEMGTRWPQCLAAMPAGSSLTNLCRSTAFNFTGCFPVFEVLVHFTVYLPVSQLPLYSSLPCTHTTPLPHTHTRTHTPWANISAP